jgi:hypothetical protein
MAAGYPLRGTAWVTHLLKIQEGAGAGRHSPPPGMHHAGAAGKGAFRFTYRFYESRFTFKEMS